MSAAAGRIVDAGAFLSDVWSSSPPSKYIYDGGGVPVGTEQLTDPIRVTFELHGTGREKFELVALIEKTEGFGKPPTQYFKVIPLERASDDNILISLKDIVSVTVDSHRGGARRRRKTRRSRRHRRRQSRRHQ